MSVKTAVRCSGAGELSGTDGFPGADGAKAAGRDVGNSEAAFPWLGHIREVRTGEWRPQTWTGEGGWRHHSKRFTVGRLACLDRSEHTVLLLLALETVPEHDRGLRAYEAFSRLWNAGLHPPARYRVPRPFAWDDGNGILVRAFVPGTTWADLVLRPDVAAPEASESAAGWLTCLQHNQALRDSLCTAPGRGDRLVRHVSEIAGRLGEAEEYRPFARVALAVAQGLDDRSPVAVVPSHGDFHPKNVLIVGPAVVALDCDHLGLREPAADVGWLLGQLLSMSLARTRSTAAGAAAALRFWRSYEPTAAGVTWDRVAVNVAATLVECIHYTVFVRGGRWPGTPRDWAGQVGHWLHSDGPRVLTQPAVSR